MRRYLRDAQVTPKPTRVNRELSRFARVLRVATVLFLPLSLLACGEAKESSDSGDETSSFTITLWEQMDPQERDVQASQIVAYEAAHPGMKIELSHYSTEDLRTQFQTAALAGSGPDLVYGPSDQVGPFSVMGLIQPLDEVLPAAELSQFRDDAFDRLGGHIYSLPDQVGNHLTLVYNKAILPQAPQTMSELIALAKEQTIDENGDGRTDRYGLVFQVMEPFWVVPFLTGYGGWVMNEANEPTLDTPAMVAALKLIYSFKSVHKIMPAECDYEIADTLFKEGRAAMTINGPWSWEAYRKAGIDLGIARIPLIDETGKWPGPMISSKGYSINAQIKGRRLEAVIEALLFLTQTDFQVEFAEKVGTLPTRKDAYDRPEVAQNPILHASSQQVETGRRMPVIPEMRAIWDAMRPGVQTVWNGSTEPAEAARKMQEKAIRKIREMKG